LATHSSVVSVGRSFTDISDAEKIRWAFHYFEIDPQRLAIFLFTMLQASSHMEEAFFGCFETRLNLDHGLVKMRNDFNLIKEEQRNYLGKTYKLHTI